ncbi:uncharacterized protein N7498_007894 [Penicillium cinerascens]|uniref:Myb-like domain-containing protein n=1 Tax=Penicillium cinerascens TaxID=70096 RepID=A0A9W9JMQ3_9EURO|nr:uncharacterized protein N7498_007894 [Penicillium cinerascens]KAJ5198777.1 hypothetical protein N7498_007894 [Penicillium cinerascens]
MSSATYRLETFRSWNPIQEKAQPSWKPLDTCRYPSPVSIMTTPSPSNPREPLLENQKIYSPRPQRHPLPVRPPAEVCLHGGLQPETQIARSEPEVSGRPSSVIAGDIETFNLEEILHVQDLPSSGNVHHTPIFDDIGRDSEYQLPSFESGDPGFDFTAGQHFQVGPPESPIQTGDLPDDVSIDPAILDNYRFPDVEEIQAVEPTPHVAVGPARPSAGKSRFFVKDACHHNKNRPHGSQRTVKSGRQSSRINKLAVVVKSQPKVETDRFAEGLGCKNVSFSTVRAQFSELSVDDRLQFLSWLFESALYHCAPVTSAKDTSTSRCILKHEKDVAPTLSNSSTSGKMGDTEYICPSRKGLPYSVEEDRLLVMLREEQKLAWSEVTKRFAQKFPGRNQSSIQVYWSTTLSKRLSLAKNS